MKVPNKSHKDIGSINLDPAKIEYRSAIYRIVVGTVVWLISMIVGIIYVNQYFLVFICSLLSLLFISTGISSLAYRSISDESISKRFKVKNQLKVCESDLPCILAFYDIRHREENRRYKSISIMNENYEPHARRFKDTVQSSFFRSAVLLTPTKSVSRSSQSKDSTRKSSLKTSKRSVPSSRSSTDNTEILPEVRISNNSGLHSRVAENLQKHFSYMFFPIIYWSDVSYLLTKFCPNLKTDKNFQRKKASNLEVFYTFFSIFRCKMT